MPKKKGSKKHNNADVTFLNCEKSVKPGRRIKNLNVDKTEVAWDGYDDDDFDIVEDANGSKNIVYKNKKKVSKETDNIEDRPGNVYPEILWYLVSRYLKPEQVSSFACICKDTYAITKTESFWRVLYMKYCHNKEKLPEKLKIENNDKGYGIRQRVIRALHYTYRPFVLALNLQSLKDSTPHLLVKRRCVTVWYNKGAFKWMVYFKLKKLNPLKRMEAGVNFVEEMSRIDANSEEDVKLLQVCCNTFQDVPPVMGMYLTSVTVGLCQGFQYKKLVLGFNSSQYVSRDIKPECSIVLDAVTTILVLDWWHPLYPHNDTVIIPPSSVPSEEATPVLEGDWDVE